MWFEPQGHQEQERLRIISIIQNIKQSKEYLYGMYRRYLSYVNYTDDGIGSGLLNRTELPALLITNSLGLTDYSKKAAD